MIAYICETRFSKIYTPRRVLSIVRAEGGLGCSVYASDLPDGTVKIRLASEIENENVLCNYLPESGPTEYVEPLSRQSVLEVKRFFSSTIYTFGDRVLIRNADAADCVGEITELANDKYAKVAIEKNQADHCKYLKGWLIIKFIDKI